MSNNTYRSLPRKKIPEQYFSTTQVFNGETQGWPRTLTSVNNTAVEDILADAVWRIDALDHQNSGAPAKIVRNLGSAGPILNCTSGSTSVADSNDPRFLDWGGTNYIYLTGVANSYLTVPDAAALDITGDIDLRIFLAADDWTPSSTNRILVAKWTAIQGNQSYRLDLLSNGIFRFFWTEDGSTSLNASSTVAPTIADGEPLWVRATLDVDNGASGRDIQFFTSTDGTNWTQLGTTVTQAGTTSIYSGAAVCSIGAIANGSFIHAMKIYKTQVLDGINGTTVLDIDTSVITSGGATSFTAVTGQTVTIVRPTAGRKTVAVTTPCWLFGTDDRLNVPNSSSGSKAVDFGPNDSFTALVIMRQWNTNSTFRGILSKYTGPGALTGPGYLIFTSSPSTTLAFIFEDFSDTGETRSSALTNGVAVVFGGVCNRYLNTLQAINASGTLAGSTASIRNTGGPSNSGVLTVGSRGGGSSYVDMEFIASAIWRRALSQNEILTLRTYYLDRWK